jgi:hypothetical protein
MIFVPERVELSYPYEAFADPSDPLPSLTVALYIAIDGRCRDT